MKTPRTILCGMLAAVIAGVVHPGNANALEVGQKAPEFTLTAPDNKPVTLAELLGKGPVVLYTFVDAAAAA